MSQFQSTKIIELGSAAFRQWRANHSHCQFVHGYQLTAKFWFGSDHLDDKNWVVDFAGLKEVKASLQDVFDHKWVVSADDPQLELIKQLEAAGVCKLSILPNGVGVERTAEFCYDLVDTYIRNATNNRCWVDQVEVFEHAINSCTYTPSKEEKEIRSYKVYIRLNTEKHADQYGSMQEALHLSSIGENSPPNATAPDTTPVRSHSVPAHVGPNNTQGKGNWFSGTTWG